MGKSSSFLRLELGKPPNPEGFSLLLLSIGCCGNSLLFDGFGKSLLTFGFGNPN